MTRWAIAAAGFFAAACAKPPEPPKAEADNAATQYMESRAAALHQAEVAAGRANRVIEQRERQMSNLEPTGDANQP